MSFLCETLSMVENLDSGVMENVESYPQVWMEANPIKCNKPGVLKWDISEVSWTVDSGHNLILITYIFFFFASVLSFYLKASLVKLHNLVLFEI